MKKEGLRYNCDYNTIITEYDSESYMQANSWIFEGAQKGIMIMMKDC